MDKYKVEFVYYTKDTGKKVYCKRLRVWNTIANDYVIFGKPQYYNYNEVEQLQNLGIEFICID